MWQLIIHSGAGTLNITDRSNVDMKDITDITDINIQNELNNIALSAAELLNLNTSVDKVVVFIISSMENSPLFNAGISGSARSPNSKGTTKRISWNNCY